MKIMQVMPEFGLAGAEIMCENLMMGLKALGQDVFAVSFFDYHSAITKRLESNGISIIYLNKKPGLDLSIYKKLQQIIKQERPDVVHTHRYVMQYVTPIAKMLKIKKNVHTVHSVAQKEQEAGKRKLAKYFYRHWGVVPVALSKEIQKTIEEEYGLSESQIPIVYNGESLSKFSPKKDYGIKGALKIVHIGRFLPVKNQLLIVESIAELKKIGIPVELLLIGDNDNSYGAEVRKTISDYHVEKEIHMVGLLDDVSSMLSTSDLFILPSEYEGMPMTLIEAMATGLPIISSSVGGIVDMLEDGDSGLLINPQKDSLVQAICRVYSDEQLRKRLGTQARVRSSMFSSETMALSYLNIYKG